MNDKMEFPPGFPECALDQVVVIRGDDQRRRLKFSEPTMDGARLEITGEEAFENLKQAGAAIALLIVGGNFS
jgi:hypothetical protein